jgi:hypothetical protein
VKPLRFFVSGFGICACITALDGFASESGTLVYCPPEFRAPRSDYIGFFDDGTLGWSEFQVSASSFCVVEYVTDRHVSTPLERATQIMIKKKNAPLSVVQASFPAGEEGL